MRYVTSCPRPIPSQCSLGGRYTTEPLRLGIMSDLLRLVEFATGSTNTCYCLHVGDLVRPRNHLQICTVREQGCCLLTICISHFHLGCDAALFMNSCSKWRSSQRGADTLTSGESARSSAMSETHLANVIIVVLGAYNCSALSRETQF